MAGGFGSLVSSSGLVFGGSSAASSADSRKKDAPDVLRQEAGQAAVWPEFISGFCGIGLGTSCVGFGIGGFGRGMGGGFGSVDRV